MSVSACPSLFQGPTSRRYRYLAPPADLYYGHRETAELCQRFIRALFACPDRPPPSTTSCSGPTPPLGQFVAYALHRTRLHTSVTFTALFLLSRLKSRFPTARGSSGHRLFLSAFMIASKVVCEDTYSNKSWTVVGQGMFSLREVNQMEREMCGHLGWNLTVDLKCLGEFEKKIRREYATDGPHPAFVHLGQSVDHPSSSTTPSSNRPPLTASQRSSEPHPSRPVSASSSVADTIPGPTWTPISKYSKEGDTSFLLINHVPGRGRGKVAQLVERALRSFRATFNHRRHLPSTPDPLDCISTDASNFRPLPCPQFRQVEPNDVGFVVDTIGDHPVGMGGSSDVWQGIMITDENSAPSLVAVKVLRQFSGGSRPHALGKRLKREVRIWQLLDHENIAGFHGVVYNSNEAPAIVSPWYANGSADVYLRQHPDTNPMTIIWEIVLGVEYLHENAIVHGDLKGANVMVDDSGHARLIDFGLSRLLDSVVGASGLTMSTVSFSLRWCAPELVLSDKAQVTKSSDVYACASTVLQLLTGDVPYSSQRERTVLLTVLKKVPPPRPSTPLRYAITNVDELWGLLERCWTDASQRPSISEVKRDMLNLYPVC